MRTSELGRGGPSVSVIGYGAWPLSNNMGEMAALQAEGKIRYLGVSNFDVSQMERALKVAPIQTLQPRYNMFDREIEAAILPFCLEQGIGILAHSPLAKGLLAGKYRPGHVFAPDDERSRFDRFQGEAFAGYIAKADRLKA